MGNKDKSYSQYLSSIEEIIEDARNGKMFILVDDEERENEGDLVIPAQMAPPDAINFMASNGKGLICLAMTQSRINELQLAPMTAENRDTHGTAFTISIEAKNGVTTGISAADRALTIAVAIDNSKGPADISSPGHVFPLASREGGVLVRAGHTEASVDIARLSGLNPAGIICEIMNEDGSMARMEDLLVFSKKHGLKIATIADLIGYRVQNDRIVKRELETKLDTVSGGNFKAIIYRNTAEVSEHMALIKGDVSSNQPVLVRMHAFNIFDDINSAEKTLELHRSMELIAEEGRGAIVMIRSSSRTGWSEFIKKREGAEEQHDNALLREYGVGAQILRDLGIRDMILLSNTERSIVGLGGHGLVIKERRDIKFGRDYKYPVRDEFYG